MGVPGHFRRQKHRVQTRRVGGEHRDAFVQVGVSGRAAELVVGGELEDVLCAMILVVAAPGMGLERPNNLFHFYLHDQHAIT